MTVTSKHKSRAYANMHILILLKQFLWFQSQTTNQLILEIIITEQKYIVGKIHKEDTNMIL